MPRARARSGLEVALVALWVRFRRRVGSSRTSATARNRGNPAILQTRAVSETFAAKGLEPVGNTPAQFAAELAALVAFWRPVVKAAGLAPK